MNRDERKKMLSELSRTAHGTALREYLKERVDAIGDITQLNSWEEAVGRKFALILVKEIFNFLEDKGSEIPPKTHEYT